MRHKENAMRDNKTETRRLDGLTIGQAKEELKNGIRSYFAKDREGNYLCGRTQRIPFFLFGAPGIGKTEITKQVAKELDLGYVSFSITHHTRNSLIGLPVIRDLEDGGKYTEYTMSELIAKPVQEAAKGHMEGILVLDELNCASDTIMPTMLAFLQTANIGMYSLPENWIIVACGNPSAFNSGAKPLTPAILDRVRLLPVEFDAATFLSYAKEHQMHQSILDYLSDHPEHIFSMSGKGEDLRMVTCRGWENLSNTIRAYETIGENLTLSTVQSFIKEPLIANGFYKYYSLTLNRFGRTEALQVIVGENHAALAETLNNGDFSLRLSAIDLVNEAVAESARAGKVKRASESITQAFAFARLLNEETVLREKLLQGFCRNPGILEVLQREKNETFLSMARESFALPERVA